MWSYLIQLSSGGLLFLVILIVTPTQSNAQMFSLITPQEKEGRGWKTMGVAASNAPKSASWIVIYEKILFSLLEYLQFGRVEVCNNLQTSGGTVDVMQMIVIWDDLFV